MLPLLSGLSEVFRSNMPAEPVTYATWALQSVTGDNEWAVYTASVSASVLVPGVNIVAVEVHQRHRPDTGQWRPKLMSDVATDRCRSTQLLGQNYMSVSVCENSRKYGCQEDRKWVEAVLNDRIDVRKLQKAKNGE